MKNIDYKNLILRILVPLLLAGIVSYLIEGSIDYEVLNKPYFAPSSWVFHVVWTILYVLIGISAYLVRDHEEIIKLYRIQLVFNLLWPVIFFILKFRLLAFICIIIILSLVNRMMNQMNKINRVAVRLLIPYFLWLVFAAILNLTIIVLN